MANKNVLLKIKENIDEIMQGKTALAQSLWRDFLEQHPVDIAEFLSDLDRDDMQKIFLKLPKALTFDVFEEFSDSLKAYCLSFLTQHDQVDILQSLSIDDLTDLFDYFSDEELTHYLNLLHKKAREQVLTMLKFHPDSAGGIMDVEVLNLRDDYTVERCIKILQRLRPDQELFRQIYITNRRHQLIGHINLEDLVVHPAKTKIANIMRKNQLVADVHEDQEAVARQMVHYNLITVPVVDEKNTFLGVIPSETLMDVIVEEANEDVQKMAALAPMKDTYLEAPFYKILVGRGGILVVLLLAESLTGVILDSYTDFIPLFLIPFITMIISTGGNASHQTSALVLQGLASGELHGSNIRRFLKREFFSAASLAFVLALTAFVRAYVTTGKLLASSIVGGALGVIVLLAVVLGSSTPLILKRFRIDPAFAAGPFLATLMDILGVLVYCILIRAILG